jgi:hypothetical protein
VVPLRYALIHRDGPIGFSGLADGRLLAVSGAERVPLSNAVDEWRVLSGNAHSVGGVDNRTFGQHLLQGTLRVVGTALIIVLAPFFVLFGGDPDGLLNSLEG